MKIKSLLLFALPALVLFQACGPKTAQNEDFAKDPDWVDPTTHRITDESGFAWQTEQFADLKIVRYQIAGWDNLTPKQKELVYYLSQAGLAGRDMMWDQNYRHNLEIRAALENIYENFKGERDTKGWHRFELYLKRVWFSNGIHHHYSNDKFVPEFSREYFDMLMAETGTTLSEEALRAIFDPNFDNKKVNSDESKGLVEGSAINFYAPDVTTEEAKAYFASIIDSTSRTPLSYGLNSRLVKDANGNITEEVYRLNGLYHGAIERIIYWLKKAEGVAENEPQAAALRQLIAYYETGDLKKWDSYNIAWLNALEGDIDYINGFVEVYNDPLGYTGSYENIVQIKDFDASERMSVLMKYAQWFEDNAPFLPQHKKEKVVGIVYNVVNVASEAGDASPVTPIGVNLPNADWIRMMHGSKSVSLGNIVEAYEKSSGSGLLEEFAHDQEEIDLAKKYGSFADKLHTALHEVIGHASGKLEDGVGSPKETISQYSNTLEEGRADLMALYFMMDPKMVEIGLMESLEVGKAEYDAYLRNGLIIQLRRIELGNNIEQAHMRNRSWVSRWVLEKGRPDNVIAEVVRDGKIYYDIQDYVKLRLLFGELLREVQRIKSQGDFQAAQNLVENYGVKIDRDFHKQILDRCAPLNLAPYGGFINPELVPEMDEAGNITDIKVNYPEDFAGQMLRYAKEYGHLSGKK
jgi:dipeptidyl-peptidase III